jgi:integrase
MGRAINRLTARQVASAKPGYHADGGGLYLLVSATGTASWVYRYRRDGRLREMGLGSASTYSLADARQRAAEQRRVLADGSDPIGARRAARAAGVRLWGTAADDYIAAQAPGWKNDAQAAQWRQSLEAYGPARDLPVASVDTTCVVELLRAIWYDKTETATRVRGRIERIWAAERVAGTVAGENPARWRGHLDALLPKPRKVTKVKHHDAMPYADVPAFVAKLEGREGLARSALRFTILTAARTGEVTGATWDEFDLVEKVWRVPGARMKNGQPHDVPLSAAALACLAGLSREAPPFPLSENGMLALLQNDPPRGLGQPFTVHGFRSSFRDWAAETTQFPSEVVEKALAHTIKSRTEAAYRRGGLLAKRRELMDAWASYCTGRKTRLAVVRSA